MNPARPAVAVLTLVLFGVPAAAADPPDPARLFPADTLAYAELVDPAAVAPDLAGLVRGSALEDGLAFVHKRKDAATEIRDLNKDELGFLALLGAPELAGELPRLRVAAGLLGFTDRGEPRWVVAVLTGESPAAGLVARAFLATSSVRKVGAAGDVPVYQYRRPAFTYDQATGRQVLDTSKPPAAGDYEPTFAYLPGLFVAASDVPAVGAVAGRFRGQGDALAGSAVFRDAAAAHRKPGVFFFADAPRYCEAADRAVKAASRGTEPDALGWFKLVADVRAVRSVAGVVRFRDGGLSVAAAAAYDPARPSPLPAFLSGPAADPGLLRHAPAGAGVAAVVALPEQDRAAAVVGLLDALAKAAGGLGALPSERAKELDATGAAPATADLVAKVRAVTVVLPAKQELPKGAVPLPVFVLHAVDSAAAEAWAGFLPRLAGNVAKSAPPRPSAEAVGGVKVWSLPAAGLPWGAPLHYAQKEATVAVGLDRAAVAAALAGDPAGSVVGKGGVPKADGAVVGLVSPGVLLRALGAAGADGPAVTPGAGAGARGRMGRFGGPNPPPDGKPTEAEGKAWDALLKVADGLPPGVLTVKREGKEVRVELWQPKAAGGGLGPAVTAGVTWFDLRLNRMGDPNAGMYPGYMR